MPKQLAAPLTVVANYIRTYAFQNPILAHQAWSLLGDDEHRTLLRIRSPAARFDYLGAHALARAMLGQFIDCDPRRLRFSRPLYGRPEILDPPEARPLCFSISHADGIAFCAVAAGCPVGADVESLRNVGEDPLATAATLWSPPELAALRETPPPLRVDRFLALWTSREAVAKASGCGLCPRVTREAELESKRWRVVSTRLTDVHLASVAVPGNGRKNRIAVHFEEHRGILAGTRNVPEWSSS